MELFKNKETELEFKINLEGNSSAPKARVLIENGGILIGIKAHVAEGIASVKIPALSSIMKETPTSCNMLLEVMVDDGYYVPWQEDSVSIKSETTVTVSEAVVKSGGKSGGKKVAAQIQEVTSRKLYEPPVEKTSQSKANIEEFLKSFKR